MAGRILTTRFGATGRWLGRTSRPHRSQHPHGMLQHIEILTSAPAPPRSGPVFADRARRGQD